MVDFTGYAGGNLATKKTEARAARQREIRFVRPEDYSTAYANNAQITLTNWDLRIDFGEIVSADAKEIVVQQKIGVVMSPQHAKALADVLARNVQDYEKLSGELKWSRGTQ